MNFIYYIIIDILLNILDILSMNELTVDKELDNIEHSEAAEQPSEPEQPSEAEQPSEPEQPSDPQDDNRDSKKNKRRNDSESEEDSLHKSNKRPKINIESDNLESNKINDSDCSESDDDDEAYLHESEARKSELINELKGANDRNKQKILSEINSLNQMINKININRS